MLSEYSSINRNKMEDLEEKSDTTAASNSHLASTLRGKEEEIADFTQLLSALREKRKQECEREKQVLELAAAQTRTVSGELFRVSVDSSQLSTISKFHGNAMEAYKAQLARSSGSSSNSEEALPSELLPQTESFMSRLSLVKELRQSLESHLPPAPKVDEIKEIQATPFSKFTSEHLDENKHESHKSSSFIAGASSASISSTQQQAKQLMSQLHALALNPVNGTSASITLAGAVAHDNLELLQLIQLLPKTSTEA
jgi:hypothetical protein